MSARAYVDWVRVPVEPALLKELNTTSDWKGWLQAGGHLLLTLCSGAGVFALWHYELYGWLVPALFIHGNIQGMLASGVHELVHERVFTTRCYNRWFLAINSFLTNWNYPFFEISHKDHHRYTLNQPHDLEVVLPSVEVLSKRKPETTGQALKRWLQFYFAWSGIVPTIRLHWAFAKGGYQRNGEPGGLFSETWCQHMFSRMNEAERLAVKRWSQIFLIGHALVIIVFCALGLWIIPVLVTFGSYFGGLLGYLTGAPQHEGLKDSVNDFRLCCRTYTCSKFFQFLYWNMNYHTEHHMYAAVPCYNLPKLHEAIKAYLPPVHTSLYSTWAEITLIHHRQLFDPTYQYEQPLPETLPGNEHLAIQRVADASAEAYLDLGGDEAPDPDADWKLWECNICGFIYDEAAGLPEEGIAPGTRWDDIPDDWACPDCGVAKADFDMIERKRVEAASAEPVPTATADEDPIVIVGSGMAGYTLAKEFRTLNQEQSVLLLTRDGGEYYAKPMLSNALAKQQDAQTLINKRAQDMANELTVTVRTGVEVSEIDRANKRLTTTAGEFLYSRLVLATGADQRQLPIDGDARDRILSVNDLAEYDRFRDALPAGGTVLILGAGLIGCEFANDLVESGYTVEILDLADTPLAALVPSEVGAALKQRLTDKGVRWHLGQAATAVNHDGDRVCCTLADGSTVTADLVLSAVGLLPRIELAKAAGLPVNRGILTDQTLQTEDPDIFALGDCSEVGHEVRLYIAPLRSGAKALARTLAGVRTEVSYPPQPVLVKTPACPVVSLKPAADQAGSWRITTHADGLECQYLDRDQRLHGFVLTDQRVKDADRLIHRLAKSA